MVAVATQNVIALHLMRIAARGDLARSEPTPHGGGKGAGAWRSASGSAAVGSMTGRNRRHIAKKVAGVYKKRVRANRRRLASRG